MARSIMTMWLLCASALLAIASGSPTIQQCRWPPNLRCSSPQIALECGVFSTCFPLIQARINTNMNAAATSRMAAKSPPVNVTLYYEALCPFCRIFINSQLYPTFVTLASTGIMNVGLVPYGNAQEAQSSSGQWTYKCQHGPQECVGNLIETCALHILKNQTIKMEFINCVENSSLNYNDFASAAKACANNLKINYAPIEQCTKSPLGNQLQHQMAVITNNLNPPHRYVPWIVLNGVHTAALQNQAQQHLLATVCQLYTGAKPSVCAQFGVGVSMRDEFH